MALAEMAKNYRIFQSQCHIKEKLRSTIWQSQELTRPGVCLCSVILPQCHQLPPLQPDQYVLCVLTSKLESGDVCQVCPIIKLRLKTSNTQTWGEVEAIVMLQLQGRGLWLCRSVACLFLELVCFREEVKVLFARVCVSEKVNISSTMFFSSPNISLSRSLPVKCTCSTK